eukprot:2520882-Ditylum_brightwellii.AAC.1
MKLNLIVQDDHAATVIESTEDGAQDSKAKNDDSIIENVVEGREGAQTQTAQNSAHGNNATTKNSTDNDAEISEEAECCQATAAGVAKDMKEEKGNDDATTKNTEKKKNQKRQINTEKKLFSMEYVRKQ